MGCEEDDEGWEGPDARDEQVGGDHCDEYLESRVESKEEGEGSSSRTERRGSISMMTVKASMSVKSSSSSSFETLSSSMSIHSTCALPRCLGIGDASFGSEVPRGARLSFRTM